MGDRNKDGKILRLLLIFFLAMPVLEIAAFIMVGSEIGVLRTLGLVALSALAGIVLLRVQGLGTMERARRELQAGRDPGRELAQGALGVLAAVLLIVPGFVTDALGLLLLLPPVRSLAWRLLRASVVVSGGFARGEAYSAGDGGPTIDLGREDYRRTGNEARNEKSPWRIDSGD